MIKHVIFDFDGTIADSFVATFKLANQLALKHGYKRVTMEELHKMNNMPMRKRIKQLNIPIYKVPQMVIELLAGYRHVLHSISIFRGMEQLFAELRAKGLSLSIISSNSTENIKDFIRKNRLDGIDDVISVKRLFGKDKAIKKHLKELDLKAEEVIYVGDELRDIEACRKAKVKIISVTWGFDTVELLKTGKPDFIAYKPEDILEIV